MLKSVVEQKMAMAVYVREGSIPVLSASNFEIAAKSSLFYLQLKKSPRVFLNPISLVIPLVQAF